MSALAVAVTRQGTPEWLEARMAGVGSSDAPIIAGESPYRSALELWAEKTGLVAPEQPDEATARLFRIGHLMEPVLLEAWAAETGLRYRRRARPKVNPREPFMFASLDADVVGEPGIVECKWSNARRWHEGEPVPGDVQVQVQHAMACTGTAYADVVALLGPELRIVRVERDEKFIGDLVELERVFWHHVETRTRPEVDGSESTRRTIARLHPVDDGTYLPATPDLVALVDRIRDAKAAKKAAEDAEATLTNALRAVIGDASGIEGLATYRKNADSLRVNWPAVASAFRSLIADRPSEELDAIESLHSTTVEGPRVLRLSKGVTE